MTIFQKIIDRELPATIVHEDAHCLAFRDIAPAAPMHILLIPKKPLASLGAATPADQALLGHLLVVAGEIARAEGYGEAFRVVTNSGAGAGQTVHHLHFHILGGRPLKWPPG